MYCKDCKHRKETDDKTFPHLPNGICTNSNAINEDYGDGDYSVMLIYCYTEGGCFHVGEKFGCVHFEKKV